MALRGCLRCVTLLQRQKVITNVRTVCGVVPEHKKIITKNENKKSCNISRGFLDVHYNLDCPPRRWKHGKRKQTRSQDEDEEDDEEDEEMQLLAHGKHNKIITPNTSSMRIDAVVKAALGIARNKADVALYESKIRVNNGKILKKGYQVNINDTIDFIVGPSPKNPKFTIVHRFTILNATPNVDTLKLKVLREKNLVVDDYVGSYKIESTD